MASRPINFSYSSNEDVKNYKQNDKSKFGFGAGFSLELKVPHNYFIRTGISYWNVGERNTSEYYSRSNSTISVNTNDPQFTVRIDLTAKIPSISLLFTSGKSISIPAITEIKASVSNFTK